ncbi:selenocysteine-specific translation elongation factor [Methylobacterium sp. WSM2598]|uniref:selenocysteine-specific translation elongation factor n=1 Tax=Methylobacterium sp. WSM2598 TaxID=398261 RepID=UPI0003A72FBC|nr:selenocysteine-specific translation elongation factor [Methylobacterium sp. WSM2598]
MEHGQARGAGAARGGRAGRALVVGVIGHVDHGKTALVRALTGTDTDRLKEERERGVSIVPGFALLRVPGGEIDLVDLPGHERFVRAMIAGATGLRAILLAVDAREGIKPQTLEHLAIARLIGVDRGVVALTKCDLVTDSEAAARAAEVGALAAASGLAVRIVRTSVLREEGLADLAGHLADLLGEVPPSPDDGCPVLPIDRVFPRAGFGAVVTGTLRRGRLALGDAVAVAPEGIEGAVRALQSHGRPVQAAEPGRRVAVALRGIDLAQLRRGQVLAPPGYLVPSRWLDVSLTLLREAPVPLAGGARLRLLAGTADVPVRLRLLDRDALDPGETAPAQLHAEEAVALPAREPFLLRSDAPPLTLGGGVVLDPASRRRRRRDAAGLAELRRLAEGRPAEILRARLAAAGRAGATLADLSRLVGIAPERVRRHLVGLGAEAIGERVLGAEVRDALRSEALAALDAHHRAHPLEHGISHARLATALRTGEAVAAAILRDLVAAGRAVRDRDLVRAAAFDPQRQEPALVRGLAESFRRAGLTPPDEAEAAGRDPRRREALNHLVRSGTLIRAADRVQRRTILFHREAVEAAKQALARAFAGQDGFLAREAGALLGISRKFSIPLLEHLDAVRFTRRLGDRRVLLQAEAGPRPSSSP